VSNVEKETGQVRECTGCQFCAAVCPRKAIQVTLDDEGFFRPSILEERCTDCGLCVKYCYKYDTQIWMTPHSGSVVAYSARVRDLAWLNSSTSGGIATMLMKKCVELGYHVVGVAYDYETDMAVAETTSDVGRIPAFKGSKYMPVYTLGAYQEVLEREGGRKYAVFGLPCHIYPLYRRATTMGTRDRYLFVDFFCHGYPSIKLWRKYAESVKKRLGTSRFDRVCFRSKQRGWHEFVHTFSANGVEYVSPRTVWDPFFTIFFDDLILGASCYNCQLRSTMEYTDIRLGDYWGEIHEMDTKGVSAVAISSTRGQRLFGEIADLVDIGATDFKDIARYQYYGRCFAVDLRSRQRTLGLLQSERDMTDVFKDYIRAYGKGKKLERIVRIVVSLLPRRLQFWCKALYRRLVHMV
jgi:ferredoxin